MNLQITPNQVTLITHRKFFTSIGGKSGNCHSDMIVDLEDLFLEAGELGLGLLEGTEDLQYYYLQEMD